MGTKYEFIRNRNLLLNQERDDLYIPSLDLEAPGPSRVASSHIGSAEKSFAKPSHKNIVGSSLGDGSGDDPDDVTLDGQTDEDVIGWVNQFDLLKTSVHLMPKFLFSKVLKVKFENFTKINIYNNVAIKSPEEEFWLFYRI